jgi:hypothetical protein
MLAMMSGGVPGITAVDQYVALGPGDQERRHVVGADVVEIPGDAERLGVLLSAVSRRVKPLAEEHHSNDARHACQQNYRTSPGDQSHLRFRQCLDKDHVKVLCMTKYDNE